MRVVILILFSDSPLRPFRISITRAAGLPSHRHDPRRKYLASRRCRPRTPKSLPTSSAATRSASRTMWCLLMVMPFYPIEVVETGETGWVRDLAVDPRSFASC